MSLLKKDLMILQAMSLDARTTLTDLSKKTKLSKQALSYRLKILQEEKFLLQTYAIINPYALGKIHFRLFIKLKTMTLSEEKEYYDYLDSNNKISWYAIADGEFDSGIILWAKSIREYEATYVEIMKRFGKYFEKFKFSVATKIIYCKSNYLINSDEKVFLELKTFDREVFLDELDEQIIHFLNVDARINIVEIANKTNRSSKLIHDRLRKLQRNNVILGFQIKLDHKKLGFTHRKVQLWLNDIADESMKKLISYIKSQSSTIFIVSTIGDSNLEFELMTKSNEEYYQILKKLKNTFPKLILKYTNIIIYQEPKSGLLE